MAEPIGPGTFSEFSPHIACDLNTGCWLWARSLTAGGYGRVGLGRRGRGAYAHRASFEFHCRALRPGEVVCHRCDTPACVNPAHLFAGTQTGNMRDAWAKGRLRDPNRDRATAPDVIAAIKSELADGVQGRVIASDYGISEATVSAIKNGHRWTLIQSLKAPSPQITEDA